MKRCPTCNRSFDDDTLSFCLDDGTPLAADSAGNRDLQKTLVSPPPSVPRSVSGSGMPATQSYNLPGKATLSSSQSQIPIAQYVPATKTRKTWPWIVAIMAVLFIVIVVGVLIAFLPAMIRDNRPQPTPTPVKQTTPTPGPSTWNVEDDLPTDKDEVTAQLSKLEGEWEEANVKGDKEALERILAEEYLGDSKTKRQYIDSLTPSSDVQSWEIQKLGVDQNGDRATVHGRLREETKEGPQVYEFTDEFVWRDHRWQAVTAHSSSVK